METETGDWTFWGADIVRVYYAIISMYFLGG